MRERIEKDLYIEGIKGIFICKNPSHPYRVEGEIEISRRKATIHVRKSSGPNRFLLKIYSGKCFGCGYFEIEDRIGRWKGYFRNGNPVWLRIEVIGEDNEGFYYRGFIPFEFDRVKVRIYE